jgi:transcriptional regulator with XRE-family HTH domain
MIAGQELFVVCRIRYTEGMNAVITDETAKEHLAANLNRILAERGLSGRQLAMMTGETPMMISRILRGVYVPTVAVVARICEALGVNIDRVLYDTPASPTPKKLRHSA